MPRVLDDWLPAFLQYASITEAPKKMHFWSGVGAIAGALRRRVWIDMKRFTWTPSFYVIYVAPPGIVAKSTTADIGMDLLRSVPGIKFGPDVVTWQSLVTSFAAASESFEWNGEWHPMSPLTLVASELGLFINLENKEMVNLLIALWDGRKRLEKQTKMSGNDMVEAPWINLQGCTTPHWVAENMPPSMIGGGLSSRCVFVYADQKEKYVAYVDEAVSENDHILREGLVNDLEHISQLAGSFIITEHARAWERKRYREFWEEVTTKMDDRMAEGYAARKQTHLHKLAMILAVSRSDDLTIDLIDLQTAEVMLQELEPDMHKVFSRIGRSEASVEIERLMDAVKRMKKISLIDAYRLVHGYFSNPQDFDNALLGLVRAGRIRMVTEGSTPMLVSLET